MTKTLRHNLPILKTKKSFCDEIKSIFIYFKGLSSAQIKPSVLGVESPALIVRLSTYSEVNLKWMSFQSRIISSEPKSSAF